MNPGAVVVDASVVIPLIHAEREPFLKDCLRLGSDIRAKGLQALVPGLFYYELANFMAMKKAVPDSSKQAFQSILELDFAVHHMEPEEFSKVTTIARHHGISAYDASYYHVAEIFEVPLWTSDDRLLKAWGDRPGGHIKNYRSF